MQDAVTNHIEISPGTAGGKPRISGRRITVQNIVIWCERMGMSPDTVASEYNLTLAEIFAALAFYHDHRKEIDKSIRSDEMFIKELQNKSPSLLKEKLGV